MTEELRFDLENWMSSLPDLLKDAPFIYLAIPGSHDSMTYGITRKSGLAPDAPPAVRQIWPLFRGSIVRWTKTQDVDVTEQLLRGIRYFDLRLATKTGSQDLFFTHGLYADEITDGLNSIKLFLEGHPQEVVILDCQHFYAFGIEDHRKLFSMLINTFGMRICPQRRDLETITLNYLNKHRQQVIIVYRNNVGHNSDKFWRNGQLPTPWPEQVTTRGLLRWMASVRRSPSAGFVLQAILTPDVPFIILRWRSTIRDSCAEPVTKRVLPWIQNLLPGPPPPGSSTDTVRVNVVIADFIDLHDNIFSNSIIALNYKMLPKED